MKPTQTSNRRAFLQTAARCGAAAAMTFTAASWSRVLGANDRLQLGIIGPGVRGRNVLQRFLAAGGVEVRAMADIWAEQIDQTKEIAPEATAYKDYRKMLDAGKLDIALVATPDHWHAQHSIACLNAGLDLYVEKPLTLRIEEGPEIVKAARVNRRVCQVGMQQRSGKHYLEAKERFMDSGLIGGVTYVKTWWHGNTYHVRTAPERLQERPDNLDWATFLGPVRWRDWDPQQYWNWRAYLDFGGGQITDLFTHWVDVVHMFRGVDIPVSAAAAGGVYHFKDGRTAPDTINVLLEYPDDTTVTFEATLVGGAREAGIEFYGTGGRLSIDRTGYRFDPADDEEEPVVSEEQDPRALTFDHVKNFLECVRSRKRPNGDVLAGHRSAQASHLGNIAYLEKRRLKFDPVQEEILPL